MVGLKSRLLVQLGLAAILSLAVGAQARDADVVLREMRAALGGDAALDAIQTWSVSGNVTSSPGSFRTNSSLEVFAMLPDHFMEIRRHLSSPPGPVRMDIETTNYRGFRGDVRIRRTDSTFPVPPDPGPQTPAAIAERDRRAVLGHKREFARLAVALFGKSFAGSPIAFSYAGPDTVEGQPAEVLEMRTTDGFVMRLTVNRDTHLPAVIAWQAPAPVVFTTTSTSTMTVRGGQVMSETPPVFNPTGPPPAPGPDVLWRTVFSEFKLQDGVNWPHRVKEMVGDKVTGDMKLGKFKINPKIDARKFNVGR